MRPSPARCQPIVPFLSATTRLGTPALMSDCAPMIERVRPAQLTTTKVKGSGATWKMRCTSSAPGQSRPPGMFILRYSSIGRESRITILSPEAASAAISAASMRGVPSWCSTNSPKALLGTLMPVKTSYPAARQAASPPPRIETSR